MASVYMNMNVYMMRECVNLKVASWIANELSFKDFFEKSNCKIQKDANGATDRHKHFKNTNPVSESRGTVETTDECRIILQKRLAKATTNV